MRGQIHFCSARMQPGFLQAQGSGFSHRVFANSLMGLLIKLPFVRCCDVIIDPPSPSASGRAFLQNPESCISSSKKIKRLYRSQLRESTLFLWLESHALERAAQKSLVMSVQSSARSRWLLSCEVLSGCRLGDALRAVWILGIALC